MFLLHISTDCTQHTLKGLVTQGCPTVNRFSVRISSERFSQSPMASVTSHSRFWSTFRIDSCFS